MSVNKQSIKNYPVWLKSSPTKLIQILEKRDREKNLLIGSLIEINCFNYLERLS